MSQEIRGQSITTGFICGPLMGCFPLDFDAPKPTRENLIAYARQSDLAEDPLVIDLVDALEAANAKLESENVRIANLTLQLSEANAKLARIAELTYDVNSASPYDFDTGWNDAMAAVRKALADD